MTDSMNYRSHNLLTPITAYTTEQHPLKRRKTHLRNKKANKSKTNMLTHQWHYLPESESLSLEYQLFLSPLSCKQLRTMLLHRTNIFNHCWF